MMGRPQLEPQLITVTDAPEAQQISAALSQGYTAEALRQVAAIVERSEYHCFGTQMMGIGGVHDIVMQRFETPDEIIERITYNVDAEGLFYQLTPDRQGVVYSPDNRHHYYYNPGGRSYTLAQNDAGEVVIEFEDPPVYW